ncbi:MAG: helix-turn-helix domain-containing protein, partial [Chloroflexota bacterium]|nr:helix-turn-helix domain-containing protein [Chloroflexota bacterium]
MSYGNWVRRLRRTLDLTQTELAQRVGCAPTTIEKIEVDARRPSKAMAERLADALELAPELRPAFLRSARSGVWVGEDAVPSRSPAPPAAARARITGALPVAATPLIGRAREIATVCDVLGTPGVRVLALIGPGGIGKTRVA